MRQLLLFMILMGVAGRAGGADFSNHNTGPDKDAYVGDGMRDTREGGEDFGSAIPILDWIYNDTGATCDNSDDITLPCAASAAPDVVYRFVASNSYPVSVNLCGSGYDTALAIYDQNQVCIACNDDFCGLQSQVDVAVTAGQTYYIVVDGFSTNCGSYSLTFFGGIAPPTIPCPVGAVQEGEPPCHDDYYDAFNGGCNSTGWTPLCPQEGNAVVVCGKSGNYLFNGLSYRDTDWFRARGIGGTMTATVRAVFPVELIFIHGADCSNLEYDMATGTWFEDVSLSRFVDRGAEVWIWVGPSVFTGVPCETGYVLTMDGIGNAQGCLGIEPSSVDEIELGSGNRKETTSWGMIKSAYR